MDNRDFIVGRLSDSDKLYLNNYLADCNTNLDDKKTATMDFWALYRVDEVTFEDKAPRKEALENVISSMCIDGVNFIYLIIGDSKGVKFYYGVARDLLFLEDYELEIADIGHNILMPSLRGNFRGSIITEIDPNERKQILDYVHNLEEVRVLEGVPGINKDDEKFQSVDRMIDVMLGNNFALLLIAKPITGNDINKIQNGIYHLYDSILPIGKASVQESSGKSTGSSESQTSGKSETEGTNSSKSDQVGVSYSTSHTSGITNGTSKGTQVNSTNGKTGGSEGSHSDKNSSDSKSDSKSNSTSTSKGDSKSSTESTSTTESTQTGNNIGSATTIEVVNKKVQDWIKYMDEVILPRLDYGKGKGLFVTSTVLMGETPASLIKLENTLKSIYGGETGNVMPLKAFKYGQAVINHLRYMQIPRLKVNEFARKDVEKEIRMACSQLYSGEDEMFLGNWISSQELSLIASLPQKEVVGMTLREEVEFGLNLNNESADNGTNSDETIKLGHLVQSGIVLDGKNGVPIIPVNFEKSCFDKHIFVTGVTGGGKTTTCQRLLIESGCNFMVIEPAKTEYRAMVLDDKNILVFTLGKETVAPFRLNPFEFFKGENITSRVDMIKASLEAAFDMEAAIPQLFETAIYECYKDKGWDIATNKNYKYQNPYEDGVFSFPTLGDLEKKIEKVVKDQGFGDRLKDEYIGSMRARLKGLTEGAKGLMLNTPRSIDFVEMLEKKVILELDYIKNASEKSLIMGFILSNLSEAIKVKYSEKNNSNIHHITLVEEAHRLLSKYMPGDSMNKKQGVEMFTDMLAEVRKYGESLIIADQIPNKLTPEVLKNTNTKIVHKIFAQDDKEAIGNTMALKEEQKEYLSYLTSGRAVMSMPGFSKAIQVQIIKDEKNDTERKPTDDTELRKRIIKYYANVYKKGILPGLERLKDKPDDELVSVYLEYLQPSSQLKKEYIDCIYKHKASETLINEIQRLNELCDMKIIAQILCCLCHRKSHLEEHPVIFDYVSELLGYISKDGKGFNMDDYRKEQFEKYKYLDCSLERGY